MKPAAPETSTAMTGHVLARPRREITRQDRAAAVLPLDCATVTILVIAMAVFIVSHVLLSSAPLRAPLVRLIGEGAFAGVYSVAALVLIVWTVIAFEHAPVEPLWALPW